MTYPHLALIRLLSTQRALARSILHVLNVEEYQALDLTKLVSSYVAPKTGVSANRGLHSVEKG